MLLIDTYNVLHTSGILPPDLAGLDADDLATLISQSRYAGREARLICDGLRAAPPSRRTGVEFVFAGPGKDADSLIERILQSNSAPRRLLVVSSDRRVQTAARRRRAQSLSSERFLAQLAQDRLHPPPAALPAFTRQIPLDPYSVAEWMRVFGMDPPDPEVLRRRISHHPPPAPTSAPQLPGPTGSGRVERPPSLPPTDPTLLAAMKEWPGRVGLDDLDMRKWLGELQSDRPSRPRPSDTRRRGPA